MRTTVEITDEHHQALAALALKRSLRGFSSLVQEALDLYLSRERQHHIEETLALRGSLSEEESEEMRRHIDEAWATWPEV